MVYLHQNKEREWITEEEEEEEEEEGIDNSRFFCYYTLVMNVPPGARNSVASLRESKTRAV
jgi:hypothetical protein